MSQDFFSESKPNESINIDFKRVIYRAVQYWYVIVLFLLLAFVGAFLRNRYATRIYPVTASIIFKEADDISGAGLLYNNPLVSYRPNYLNELYIIRSYPLIEKVLEDLNFEVTFQKEGNFLVSETYEIPVEATVLNKEKLPYNESFQFTAINERAFELKPKEDDDGVEGQEFAFGDTIQYKSLEAVFNLNTGEDLGRFINKPFIFNYTPVTYLTGSYVDKLDAVWAEEGSGVINLTINGPYPAKETDFLRGLIQTYQEYNLEKKNQTAARTVSFISGQLEGITDSLQHVELQLQRFKDQNVVTDLSGEALRLYKKLEELEAEKAEGIISNNYYNYLTDYIQRSENLDHIILPSSIGISDPILTTLVSNMVTIQMELKMMRRTENPLANDSRRRIDEIKKDIVEAVANLRSTDKIKQDYLTRQINTVERQLSSLPVAQRRLVSIQRNYSLLENLYIFLLQKRSEAAISQASNTSDIIVVNPPLAGGPIAPKTMQNYLVAGFVGLGLPFLIFVLLEVLNTRVQSREDIEKITTIPFIGGVGHKKMGSNLEVLSRPKTSIAESFRALRSNLNYFMGKREKGVFLITSSISGEGKTFTSINLASVLALSNKATLIVGADMRRPKIFDDFNLNNQVGLSTYLAGMSDFENVVQKTSWQYLDFISSGPVPPNPSELLLTARMEEFIATAKQRYSYVIIDTPPLAIVTDAFMLSNFADHTLFLVRQNYTHKLLLKTVQDFYSSGKLKNISIVLNDIYKSGPGYGYGAGYGYGYGYYGYGYLSKNGSGGYYSEDKIR